MYPFPHDDVALFIFHLTQQFTQVLDFHLQRIAGGFAFWDVDDPVDVEGDFFSGGRPVFVGEAVEEFAVGVGVEGVVARRGGALVDDVVAVGMLDLWVEGDVSQFVHDVSWGCSQREGKALPRNQLPDCLRRQTPDLRPGKSRSSYHLCAVVRESILENGRRG